MKGESPLQIIQLRALTDNYIYLLHSDGVTMVVDPSESAPVLVETQRRGWRLDAILITHHHWDHTGGNEELKARTGCTVIGFVGDVHRIPGLDKTVREGDIICVGKREGRVLEIPGHTTGHIAYFFGSELALFCGDTLFSLGCGRLFEGTPHQMWGSLQKICGLPELTRVFCAHEYSESNLPFALSMEPENALLLPTAKKIRELRARAKPTVPTLLKEEKATNPLLRPQSRDIRVRLQMEHAPDVEVFAELRRRRDTFPALPTISGT